MINLKFLKGPILLALLITALPSLGFSGEEEEKLSTKMTTLAQEALGLEIKVEELKNDIGTLVKVIKEHERFLDFTFSSTANRNDRDIELIQAEYRFKKGEITQPALAAIQNRVGAASRFDALPTALNPVLRGGVSPGLPANNTSVSVTSLAQEAGANLVHDPVHSTPNRGMSIGTVPPSTIRANPASIAVLSSSLQKLFLEDADGEVVKKYSK